MKKLAFFGALLLLASCATYNAKRAEKAHEKKMAMPQSELDRYRVSGDTIYYDEAPTGFISNVEWEYIPGSDMRMEISVTLANKFDDDQVMGIMKYIHAKHSKAKVEINYDER